MIFDSFPRRPRTARLTPDFASVRFSLSHFDLIGVARCQEVNGGGGRSRVERFRREYVSYALCVAPITPVEGMRAGKRSRSRWPLSHGDKIGAEMRVSGNSRSYFPRRLSPNVDGLSSPKDFPSTSALCVMHTSLTITPCTQEARNFAGFEQSRTSQTPSLTGSKYNSGLVVIACSPLLLVATRPGYFNESRIPSCDYFAFGFFPRPDLIFAQRSTAFLLPWSWSCFSTPFASMRLCIGATDRSDLDSPGVPARAAFGKGDRKCSGSLRFCNSR